MEKLVNFEAEDIQQIQYDDYDEKEFAIARVGYLSTRPNAHHLEIPEDVLRGCADTVLGKWMVAKMNYLGTDSTTHEPTEQIMGIFPKDQEVEFIEDDDGYLRAYATAVISKMYAKKYCKMFEVENNRPVSVEMSISTENGKDMDDKVLSFNIIGVTTLGLSVRPSCPESDVTFVRFSQEDADAYFNELNEHNLTPLKKFAKERSASMAKTYKIDKSKEAMSNNDWSDVDKAAMRDKIMEAENRDTLVKAVYLLIEDGWRDAPSEHLKYPVMELKGDTFIYNRNALSTALGYAKKENETSVVNKVEKIYKKLDLDDNEGGKEEKMAEVEFSAVNIGDLWGDVWEAIRSKYPSGEYGSVYSIDSIWEEDNKKFALIRKRDESDLYRLDFSLTEDKLELADEIVKVEIDIVETDKVRKFAEPENVEQYRKFADPEDKLDEEVEMSVDEMKAKIAELQAEIENRDNIIMEKDEAIKTKDVELADLRAFKQTCMEAERGSKVDTVMSEVAKFMDKTQVEEYRKEGLTCEFAEIDAWANKVKASVFDKATKQPDNGEFTRMSAPLEIKKTGSVWERL
nr:MAG TPA: hypothetical protein [Herelleviridae sp.]